MPLWCVKGGEQGQRESRMLSGSVLGIGWEELGDLSNIQAREELDSLYESTYPDAEGGRRANHVGQLWAFVHRMQVGDLIVVPLKTTREIAVGKVESGYQFRSDLGVDMRHTRKVGWMRTDLPRQSFESDLLYSFGAFMAVCQVTRNDAERRVMAVVTESPPPVPPDEPIAEGSLDIEEAAQDQIIAFIERKFTGHGMARLVDGILRAQGHTTRVSPPGPDGGVDILAGSGSLGFDPPRLCVQVKSGDSRVDLPTYQALVGAMQERSADHGLLVSWAGFKPTVEQESVRSFFRVRLWDASRLVTALLENYGGLPPDIQAELPLKNIWALAVPIGEE